MRNVSYALLVALVLVLVAALGAVAGRRLLIGEIREQLGRNPMNTLSHGTSLADVIAEPDRAAASACYLGGSPRFDEISWAPPAVPAPFVGFGPRPGRHLNAFITVGQLRAARDPVVPKPAGRTRIVLVGGSVAFGSGAPSQDRTIGGYLEALLGDAEVLTLAYPWWTSTHERIAIENRVASLEPDLVLVLSGVNDVAAAALGKDVRWMRTPVDDFFRARVSDDYVLAGFPPLDEVVPPSATAPAPELVAERLRANVLLEAQALPGRLLFLLQPCLFSSKKPLTARERAILARNPDTTARYFASCYREIRAAFEGARVFADVSSTFDGVTEDVLLDTVHCGDRGNDLIARRIQTLLARR